MLMRVHVAIMLQHQLRPRSKKLEGRGCMDAGLRDVALHMLRHVKPKNKQNIPLKQLPLGRGSRE